MNNKQVSIIKQQLSIKDGHPVVTSLTLADAFGKQHAHVLRDIEALDCSRDFHLSNFGEIFYSDSYGRQQRAYMATKNGFMFLAMGYTGATAAQIKEAYIMAFDLMEEEIRSGMAGTKAAAIDAMLAVISEAAGKGYPAKFIPLLVQYRRAGLSCEQTGKILGINSSSVSIWHRKIEAAGAEMPKGGKTSSTVAHFKQRAATPRQLSLLEGEA